MNRYESHSTKTTILCQRWQWQTVSVPAAALCKTNRTGWTTSLTNGEHAWQNSIVIFIFCAIQIHLLTHLQLIGTAARISKWRAKSASVKLPPLRLYRRTKLNEKFCHYICPNNWSDTKIQICLNKHNSTVINVILCTLITMYWSPLKLPKFR